MAAVQLGAHPVYIQKDEVGIGTRETPEDVARTLACYHALICARVARHAHLEAMATATDTPLLNLLSERAHPLQALADLLTASEARGIATSLEIDPDLRLGHEAEALLFRAAQEAVRNVIKHA